MAKFNDFNIDTTHCNDQLEDSLFDQPDLYEDGQFKRFKFDMTVVDDKFVIAFEAENIASVEEDESYVEFMNNYNFPAVLPSPSTITVTFTIERSALFPNTITFNKTSGDGLSSITFGPDPGTEVIQLESGSTYSIVGTGNLQVLAPNVIGLEDGIDSDYNDLVVTATVDGLPYNGFISETQFQVSNIEESGKVTDTSERYINSVGIVQFDKETLLPKRYSHKVKQKLDDTEDLELQSESIQERVGKYLPAYEIDDADVLVYYIDRIRSNDDFNDLSIDPTNSRFRINKVISGTNDSHEVFLDIIENDEVEQVKYTSMFLADIPEHYVNRALIDLKIIDKSYVEELDNEAILCNGPKVKNYIGGVQFDQWSFVLGGREARNRIQSLETVETRKIVDNQFNNNYFHPEFLLDADKEQWHVDNDGVVYYHPSARDELFVIDENSPLVPFTDRYDESGELNGRDYLPGVVPTNAIYEVSSVAEGVIPDNIIDGIVTGEYPQRCQIPWNYLTEQNLQTNHFKSKFEFFDTETVIANQYPIYVNKSDQLNVLYPEVMSAQSFRLKNMYDPNWQTDITQSDFTAERTLNGMRKYYNVGRDSNNIWLAYTYRDIENINNFDQFELLERIEGFYKLSSCPLHKSNVYSILIENSGLNERLLRGDHTADSNSPAFNEAIKIKVQELVEQNIRKLIDKVAPVHTQLWRIIWKGE